MAVVQRNLSSFNQKPSMEGECILVHLDISALGIGYQNSSCTPRNRGLLVSHIWNESAYLSVASLSFSIALRSSVLHAADKLVRGVVAKLPLTDPVGVDVAVDEPVAFCLAACLAAFSARRFCLDADWGGILVSSREREWADGEAGYHRGEGDPKSISRNFSVIAGRCLNRDCPRNEVITRNYE